MELSGPHGWRSFKHGYALSTDHRDGLVFGQLVQALQGLFQIIGIEPVVIITKQHKLVSGGQIPVSRAKESPSCGSCR